MDEVNEYLFMSWTIADKMAPTVAMDFFPFASVLMFTPGSPRETFTLSSEQSRGLKYVHSITLSLVYFNWVWQ